MNMVFTMGIIMSLYLLLSLLFDSLNSKYHQLNLLHNSTFFLYLLNSKFLNMYTITVYRYNPHHNECTLLCLNYNMDSIRYNFDKHFLWNKENFRGILILDLIFSFFIFLIFHLILDSHPIL